MSEMVKMPEPVAFYETEGDEWHIYPRGTSTYEHIRDHQKDRIGVYVFALYTAAQLQEAARQAMEGHEKMRGGKPVTFWRDDALEAAAGIAETYQADPQIAIDIRAMKSRLKEWWRGVSPATGSES